MRFYLALYIERFFAVYVEYRTILLILFHISDIMSIRLHERKNLIVTVTATEFKTNFGKYLGLIATEDIFITRNGKTVAKVVNPQVSAVDSLYGLLKDVSCDIDMKCLKIEKQTPKNLPSMV